MIWPIVFLLLGLSLPGIVIIFPRIIRFLLPDNSVYIQKKISLIAIIQAILMTFLMAITGVILSQQTGLNDPILNQLLQGRVPWGLIQEGLLPVFLYSCLALIGFIALFYHFAARRLDPSSYAVLKKIRHVVQLDGCLLYGAVVEEILARWGLLNLISFFSFLFLGHKSVGGLFFATLVSALLFATGQLPAYLAAGGQNSRAFVFTLILLLTWPSLIFSIVFIYHGLLFAIISHMLFFVGWYLYDKS